MNKISAVLFTLILSAPAFGAIANTAELWRDRGDIHSLDVLHGPGGKEHEPSGVFRFLEEDKEGTSPKFEVEDAKGNKWKVKLGEESKAETAATRLLWAAGYFADEDYYLPELHVDGMQKLRRGASLVFADGAIHGARLELHIKGQKKSGNWSWFENPYVGTREFNGLRTVMALVNNWDLKEVNNAIYAEKGDEARYVVSDMGATFGRTGNPFTRSKSNLRDYSSSHFLQRINEDTVDFSLKSRPFFLTVFDLPNYRTRTRMETVGKRIPRADAKWLGGILGQLSPAQLADCFRAAGYSAEEVSGYVAVVHGRIAELNKL